MEIFTAATYLDREPLTFFIVLLVTDDLKHVVACSALENTIRMIQQQTE